MRIKGVFKPSDHPDGPDGDVADLFAYLCPGADNPEIDESHAGLAILAHNPMLARKFADLSRFIALETGWAKRVDLRELAIQAVNLHFKSDYSYRSRLHIAPAVGVSLDQLAALRDWHASSLFDDEQRLVIEYANAVAAGDVPAGLLMSVVGHFGQTQAVELTSLVAFWSAWAMIINAAQPRFDSAPDA